MLTVELAASEGPMQIVRSPQTACGIRFSIRSDAEEVARAYLYVMHNDLHDAPFGLLEDVATAVSGWAG